MFTLIVVLLVHSTDLALFPLKKTKTKTKRTKKQNKKTKNKIHNKTKKRIKRPGPSSPNSSNAILLRLFFWNN